MTIALPFFSQAEIIETPHIADVLAYIDEDSWFLVDLDNTLYEAKQAFGHVHHLYDELQQRMHKGMTREEALVDAYPHWAKVQYACPVKPLEEDFVPSLLALQKRGVVVMGLTHRHPTVALPTISQVASLDVDFAITAPSKDAFNIPAQHPAYYVQGILFCSDFNLKSDIFFTFIDAIKKSPKKVVFIDDRKKNVEEVVENLSKFGIECTGIYYTAIDHVEPVYSREVADVQAKFVGQILSNEAASLLLEHGLE
jgi:hypothetical protein